MVRRHGIERVFIAGAKLIVIPSQEHPVAQNRGNITVAYIRFVIDTRSRVKTSTRSRMNLRQAVAVRLRKNAVAVGYIILITGITDIQIMISNIPITG